MASPNQSCPSFFARPSSSARFRGQALLSALRELHKRSWSSHANHDTGGSSVAGGSSNSGSRPASAYSVRSHASHATASTSSPGRPITPGTEHAGPKSRGSLDTGVGIEFLEEVARHVGPTETVAELTDTLLAPAAKQAGVSSFLAIPRLVHARMVGPPTYIAACVPTAIRVHVLVAALKQHAALHAVPGSPPPRYWLDCFTGYHHSQAGQQSEQRQAQRMESVQRAVAQGARGALLLLDQGCTALKHAWPLHDVLWVVKAHGPQALQVVPYDSATTALLRPHLAVYAEHLNIAKCQLPGNAAEQWQERQKLANALKPHCITLEAFGAWIREALADAVRQCDAVGKPGLHWDDGQVDKEEDGGAAGSNTLFLSAAEPQQMQQRHSLPPEPQPVTA